MKNAFESGATPEAALEQINPRERRYEIGQFFTPEPIAGFMADAVREIRPETVLDPGVGGGVLLRSVGPGPRRFGCDIDPEAVRLATTSLAAQGGEVEIAEANFLDAGRWPFSANEFDAVISNPPYIRHHNLTAGQKELAKRYSAIFGTKVSTLSGSYVYFFFEAIRRLRSGGRLVFITPAEFLDVRYGAAVKQVLLEHCRLDEVIVLEMTDLAFEGTLTTSAITVATKHQGSRARVRFTEARYRGSVMRGRGVRLASETLDPEVPWTALLPSRAERIGPLLKGRTARLDDYARVRRGIATGDNGFFCLTQGVVDHWRIEPEYLVPVVLGSKDLPDAGTPFTRERWERLRALGARSLLLWCHKAKSELVGTNVLRYIVAGERQGVQDRFNCRSRDPWYSVEQVPPPDFFVTYMSRQQARFVRNRSGARCMSSLLNVWVRDGIDPEELRLVLEDEANAQILRECGRTYGGGLGKIEPNDLRALPLFPLPAEPARAAA